MLEADPRLLTTDQIRELRSYIRYIEAARRAFPEIVEEEEMDDSITEPSRVLLARLRRVVERAEQERRRGRSYPQAPH